MGYSNLDKNNKVHKYKDSCLIQMSNYQDSVHTTHTQNIG